MIQLDERKLLRNNNVVSEIERYRWIESEKCGYDIGFRYAADHWIVFYALTWLKYHAPAKRYTLNSIVRRSFKKIKN